MRTRAVVRAIVVLAMAAVSPAAFGATVTFTGGGSPQLWSDPANWSGNQVPGVSDDVVMPNAGGGTLRVDTDLNVTVHSIVVQSSAIVLVDAGGNLTVTGSSVVNAGGSLRLNSANFSGSGDLSVYGAFEIFGGTLDGPGSVTIQSGGLLQFWGTVNSSRLQRDTVNYGTINFLNFIQPGQHFGFSGGSLQNFGIIDIQTDHDVIADAGSPVLTNGSGGVIKKSAGSGSAAITFLVDNDAGGTIDVQSGTLALDAGGNVQGQYSISSGATLHLAAGQFAMANNTTLTGPGTLHTSGGNLVLNGGTLTMTGNPAVNGSIAIVGGTLDADNTVSVTWTDFAIYSGSITGAGDLHVSGNFNWFGGTITGSGARVLDSTSTPTISCSTSTCLLDGAGLQVQASTTFSASSNPLVLSNGAGLIIDPSKTLSVTNDGDITDGGGAASSIINGTIWKQTTSGTSTLGVPVILSGTSTVQIDTGTLQFGGGAGVASGATLNIAAGKTLEVTGGVFQFNFGAVSMPGSGDFKVSAGTLRVPNGVTTTIPKVTLQGSGVIDGGGTLILSGTSNWLGGTMGSAAAPGGTTQINSGNSINVTPTAAVSLTQTRQLLNNGTLSYGSTGSNILTMSGNSSILNNGTINLNDGTIGLSGSAFIGDYGTIAKVAGASTNTIFPPLHTYFGGAVSVNAGTLVLSGGGTERGAFTIASGAGLVLSTGAFALLDGPDITGNGTLDVSGAAVDVGPDDGPATCTIGVPINFSSGTINLKNATLQVSSTFSVSGTIEHYGGVIYGSGTMTINAGGVLNCSASMQDSAIGINTTVNAGGRINFACDGACGLDSNTVTNNGTIDFQADGTLENFGGSPQLLNTGTIKKSGGSGTTSVNVPVSSNSGSTLQSDSGILAFSQGGNFANVTVSGAGIVALPAAATVSGTTTLTGEIELTGNAAVSGTLNDSGTLLLDNGVDVTWPNVNLSAASSKIDGAGTLRVSGNFAWSAGTIAGSGPRVLTNTSVPGISCSLGNCLLDGAALQLQTPATFSASANSLVFSNGASLTIDSGKTLSITNDGSFTNGGGAASSIINNGTLTKSGGTGTSTLFPAVNNAGTVSATTGTLDLAGGGTNSGSFTVTSPGNLSFSGGTLSVSGGSIGGSGTVTFNGATATVGVPVNVGTLSITAGTATLNANGSANAFIMSGGTLGGSGTFTLNNGGTWSGGTMSGSGMTTNPAAMTFSIPGSVTLSGRTLQNNGTLNVSGAVIAGTGTINNVGAINDTTGATISAPVNNSGQVTTSAVLSLAGGGAHSGTFTATNAGSVIDFSGGAHTISGPFAGAGKFRFSGGTAAVNNAWSGKLIDVAGGSVAFNSSGTLPALNLSGGTLAGSGDLTIAGPSTWSGGTIGGSGALTFDTGATVSMPGTSATTLSRPLLNRGTINFTAASSAMLIDGVAVTNSGTFDIQSSQSILVTPGTPPFINNGTLRKSSGAGVMQFAAPLANTSLVQVSAGTLNFSGTYTQTAGATDVLPGATLQTAILSLNGGTLKGNGTIAGTVDNHAIVAPGASPGTLTISGDYVQAANGELDIQIGGTAPGTQYDQLLVSGNVTLGGSLNVTPISGFVPAAGNVFQVLTFGARPNYMGFAFINGLEYGFGTALVPTYSAGDLQLIANNIQADLAVSVSAPPSAANGSAFAYTVSILNQGGSDATAVTFNAVLPPNVTFNSASPAICSGAPNLVCTIGALPNQSAAVVTLGVTANGAGTAPIIVSTAASEFDPNTANNSTSASPSIADAADLRIAVTGTPSTVAGSRAIYTITVTNNGPDVAGSVAVSVTASPALSFSANGGACTGSFPCTIGALSSGQSATITSAWDISPAATGSVQLTVNAASSTPDPSSSNNSASAATIIGICPAIVITAPRELTSGAHAQASAAATGALAGGTTYNWSISDGTIDSGNGTDTITFTAGAAGTATLAVNVTGTSCTLGTTVQLTVKPRLTCQGTAAPTAPAAGFTTADAVVTFAWTAIEGSSGYRLWLQQGDAPAEDLGRTLDTSLTKVIPPGAQHWYVETLFDGCPSHESEHLALTVLPAQDCVNNGAPQLTAPANDTPASSATVAFSWGAVPKALGYELWLAPAGGVPTLIRVTSDTSYTATVPPGPFEWYVRAVFGGCAATESVHRTFTYTPPPQCTSQRPLLIAPTEGERLTSPVSFEWREVPGATSYELYVDGVLAVTTPSPHASGISVPLDERRWRVRALLAQSCGALDSAESRFAVIPPSPSCTPLEPPILTAPGQISSGVTARIQWTFVAGANAYVVQISSDPQFHPASTTSSTVTARQLPFTFTNESSEPAARYVRVCAIDTECVLPGSGPFSPVAVVSVLPPNGTMGAALLSDPADIEYTLNIPADRAGLSFIATPTASWITVTPSSGIVPPGGQTLRAFAHTAGLPPGASTGTVVITTTAAASTRAALGGPPPTNTSITVDVTSGVTTKPKNTPPPDALTIPAVANVKNFIVRYQSDVCVTNTSAQPITYDINFIPTGQSGITEGQTTNVSIEPGATLALNDIVSTWFGGVTSNGTLEIRPLTDIDTSTSSAPASGLADRITFASSRTFAVSPDGGTYGQYIPAVPYANFVSKGSVISLQQIAQSDKFRTNLGLVEGSGEPATVQVRIFDSAGTKRDEFTQVLNGGEHTQLNDVLKQRGIALDDGRIEVEVTEGEGKVTAYASVIGNESNDPLFVPPVTLGEAGHSKWVVPGVAGFTGGASNWQTDARIFNAGKDPADLTLAFYSRNGGTATSRTMTLAAGEVRRLDRVLSSFFGISQDAGALHVSSAVPARLVVTARTYNETGQGAYGQFIPAVTPEEAVAKGSRPLQILQVEQSAQYRSNVGFAEVSGKAVTLEVSVFQPGYNDPMSLEVKLAPNEFRQIDSLLSTLGLGDTFNARISVRAVEGEGRATAYLSLIDLKSGDPTYVPGQ